MFIPVANFLVLFFWIGAYFKNSTKVSRFLKNLIIMFAVAILINTPRIILHFLGASEWVNQVMLFLAIYLMPLGMAFIAIKDQEKFLEQFDKS